jgi:hypothetical protein
VSSLFVWNNALLLLLAIRLPRRLLPGASAWHRLLAGCLVFPVFAILAIFAASSIGLLTAVGVAGIVTAVALIEILLPASPPRVPANDESAAAPRASRSEAVLEAAGAALFGGVALLWIVKTGVAGTSFGFDDLTYHATASAWWLQQESLSLPPFTYQGYYPHNADLLNLWFMLPLHSDAHANLAVLVWMALAATALLAIAHDFGGVRALALLCAACFLVSPRILRLTGSFTGDDLAAASCGLTALAFAGVRAGSDSRTRWGSALLCGFAAGTAVGIKAPMIAPMGLVALWWCGWAVAGAPSRGIGRRELLVFALGLVVTGSYWYLGNWVLTGNPLFPAEVGPFAGPFDRATQWQTSIASTIAAQWREPTFWPGYALRHLDWPLPLGLTAALGYLLTLGAVVGSRRLNPIELRLYALLLVVVGLLAVVLFPLMPFSGMNNRPDASFTFRIRFLSLAFGLGLALYGSVGARRPWAVMLLAILPAWAILAGLRGLEAGDGIWVGVGAAATALLRAAWPQRPPAFTAQRVRRAGVVALAAAVVALTLWTPGKARWTAENLYSFQARARHEPTPTWSALEWLPPASRVASFSFDPSSHALYYPLFGRSLQFRVVPIDHEGRRLQPLHHDRASSRAWWWEFEAQQSAPSNLLENLRASGVDYLFISRWSGKAIRAGWPPARRVLEERAPERRIYGDDHSEIWDVRAAFDARAPRSDP